MDVGNMYLSAESNKQCIAVLPCLNCDSYALCDCVLIGFYFYTERLSLPVNHCNHKNDSSDSVILLIVK